jgi:hypothetical protein
MLQAMALQARGTLLKDFQIAILVYLKNLQLAISLFQSM